MREGPCSAGSSETGSRNCGRPGTNTGASRPSEASRDPYPFVSGCSSHFPRSERAHGWCQWPRVPCGAAMKLIIQIPCFNEARAAPRDPCRPAARGARHGRGGVARDRRRLVGRHRRGGARARRAPRRPPDQQQGPRRRLPGGAGRLPEAGRRRDREHRRRQPVLRRRHPEAGGADPRRQGRHGGRRPRDRPDRALLPAEEAPAASRQRRGAGGRRAPTCPTPRPASAPTTARPRCRCRWCPSSPTRSRRSSRRARCWWPSSTCPSHQREDARVAAVPVDVGLRAPQRRSDLPGLLALRAACACSSSPPLRWPFPRRSSGRASSTSSSPARARATCSR